MTGTGTGVGKTHVAAMIARALAAEGRKVGVYKPAASGCSRDAHGALMSNDAVALWEAAGRPGPIEKVCPQLFAAPLAPHLAARAEGRTINRDLLRWGIDYWRPKSDVIVIEGAGGLFSPLTDSDLNVDLALEFGFPLVIVTANQLGAIHGTMATISGTYQAFLRHLNRVAISCVVLNNVDVCESDMSRDSNLSQLRHFTKALKVVQLIELPHQATTFTEPVDWFKLASYRPGFPH